MSLNVLDRTREIGMLPVVDGSRKVIAQIVVTEGMFKGSLSWLFGSFWPTPLGNYPGNELGGTLISLPLASTLPIYGAIIWLNTVTILSAIACLIQLEAPHA